MTARTGQPTALSELLPSAISRAQSSPEIAPSYFFKRTILVEDATRSEGSYLRRASLSIKEAEEEMEARGFPKLYVRATTAELREDIRATVHRFIEAEYFTAPRIESPRGLFIEGPIGVGKSSLACLIVKHLTRFYSNSIGYTTLEQLTEKMFLREWDSVLSLRRRSILVIDDFSRAFDSEFGLTKINEFIEERYANRLLTFFTSNATIADLKQRAGYERVADVIGDPKWNAVLELTGTSRRRKE